MLDNETKRRIDTARDILVGKVPDPKSQVEQITIALIYKFMDDMDAEAEELGGKRKFFSGEFDRYGWKKLMAPDLGGFDVLTLYAEAIQKMNINPNIPQLFRDIFKNAYLPYRDPETLKSFLKIIDDFEYSHSEKLGDAFEYLLSVLGSQGDAGQFRTPRHIIDFMVDIIDPKKDETILDPACGTAGFLISSYKHILKHNSTNFVPEKDKEAFEQTDVSISELSAGGVKRYSGDKLTPDERAKLSKNIKGYDISPDMVRLSLVNLYLHGFTDPKIFEYDTLTSEDNWNEYADIVLANPPFMSPKGGIKPHKRFSIQSNRSEVLFVDYMVEHLTPNGKAAIIVPEGIIFQSGNAYKQLRKMLVENYLFAVVSLPAGVFQPYSGVKTSILLIDRALNKKTDKILFVKIENDGFDLGAQRRPNNKSQLPTAVKLVKEYISCCNSALGAESILSEKFGANNLWNIATKEKIAENDDWNLSGERYKSQIVSDSNYPYVKLKEICEYIRGVTYTKSDEVDKDGLKVLRANNISLDSSSLNFDDVKLINPNLKLNDSQKCKRDDILICAASGSEEHVGKVAYIKEDMDLYFGGFMASLRCNTNRLIAKYLFEILKSHQFRNYLSETTIGANIHNLKSSIIYDFEIPLPPLEIQKEIVAEIEGWQKIIDGARQVVENYKPLIDIDPEWPMVELGEVCDFKRGPFGGSLKKEIFVEDGYAVYEQSHAIADDFSNVRYFISKEKFEEMSGFELKPNDLIMSCSGTMGKIAIVPEGIKPGIINQALLKLTANTYLNNSYLKYILESNLFQSALNSYVYGAAIQNVTSVKILKQIKIPLPDLETQINVVKQIQNEERIIVSNVELKNIFEQKIKDKIAKVWGE